MTNRKFYRTVIQVEILSEERYPNIYDLSTIDYDITEGPCSGRITTIIDNEEKNGAEIAKLLREHDSDPDFFCVDENGDDTEQ